MSSHRISYGLTYSEAQAGRAMLRTRVTEYQDTRAHGFCARSSGTREVLRAPQAKRSRQHRRRSPRRRGERDPCRGVQQGWLGQRGSACAHGNRGSWPDDDCWAGRCASWPDSKITSSNAQRAAPEGYAPVDSGSNPHPPLLEQTSCDLLRKSDATLYPQGETTNLR